MDPLWLVFAAYFAVLLLIGEVFARLKVRTLDDYLLSGREHGVAVTSLSLTATVIGAGSTLGSAGVAYYVGVSAGWYLLSAGPGLVLLAYTLAPTLREMSLYTVPEYVGRRYGGWAAILAAVLGVLALALFVAAQFYAMGSLVAETTPLDLRPAIVAASLVVIAYTWRGGNWAIHWSDTFQVILIVVGIGLVVAFALDRVGGLEAFRQPPPAAGFEEVGSRWFHPVTRRPVSGWAPFALGNTVLAWIVMSTTWHFAMQSTAQRILSGRDVTVVRRSCLIAAALTLPVGAMFALSGMGARMILPGLESPGAMQMLEQVRALPALVEALLSPALAGLVLASLVAIMMSTCDSALLGSAALIVKDLSPRFRGDDAGERKETPEEEIRGSRRLVAIVGGGALVTALLTPGLVQTLELVAAVYGVALFWPLILGRYWSGANEAGAIASMVSSGLAGVGWRWGGLEEATGIHMLNVALPVAVIVLFAVSRISSRAEA